MASDGSITIECLADTNKFDKQMSELNKKINEAEKENKIKMSVSEKAKRDLDNYKQKIYEVEQEYEKLSAQKEKMDAILEKQSGGLLLTPNEFTEIQNYEEIAKKTEKIGNNLDKMYSKQDTLSQKVQSTNFAFEKSTDKVNTLKNKLNQVKLDKSKTGISEFEKGIDKVGNSLKSAVKSVGRVALAIFGIRGAITALRQASNIIGQYDEQYAANLEYIRYALAMAVKPVLEYIVGLLAKALQYVNYIASAWFGITGGIFKSADAFKSAKNSLGGMSKSAKELKNTLSGFDEIDKLTDNSSADGGIASAGGVAPNIDLTGIQGEVPSWLKWIANNKDIILTVLGGIAGFITAIKLGLGGIKALGIGVMIAGIIYTIEALLKYLKEPSWENFGKIITGIGTAILGLGIIIHGVPAIVAGAIAIIIGIIVSNWEKIKEWLEIAKNKVFEFGDKISKFFIDNFGILGTAFALMVTYISGILGGLIENFKNAWNNIFSGFKNILDGIIKIFKGDFWEGLKQIAQGVIQIFTGMWQTVYGSFKAIWDAIVRTFNKGGEIFKGMTEGISGVFKNIVNKIIDGINWVISIPFNKINQMLNTIKNFSIMGAKPFENAWGTNPLSVPKIPRLKTGGIINYPNKGVGIGGMAIGGESGIEGVIPLTDSQAMEILGETIGKYITINATINNNMDGKLISRQIQKITQQRAFAGNL